MKPLFEQALGNSWQELHPTVRRHYALVPGDELVLKGEMSEVFHSQWIKPFIHVGRLFGALVPYRGKNIPVEVHNHCQPDSNGLYFKRQFFFPNRKPYPFLSHMEHIEDNEIIEMVRFGLGIVMKVSVKERDLYYATNGYLWRIGPVQLRFPDWLFFGSGEIVERGINNDEVELDFTLTHPWFGRSFRYAGRFQLLN